MKDSTALITIKLAHTVVWAFFAVGIVAIGPLAWVGRFDLVLWLTAAVLLEAVVLLFNRWRCPLTPLAGRFTTERAPNFDIYLPRGLAQHNKSLFTALFLLGELVALARWRGWL